MKNLKFEARRKSAIARLASGEMMGHRQLVEGVYVRHCYSEPNDKLGYWDDFGFRLNRQWISVAWQHPRMLLLDHLEDLAHEAAEKIQPFQHRDFLNELTQNYKKVGRSRKVKTTSTWHSNPDNEGYFEAFREARLSYLKGGYGMDFSVPATKLKTEQMDHGRFVSLVAPVELVNEADIVAYAHKVKAHLKGDLDLFEGIRDQRYSLTNYHFDVSVTGGELV